MKIMGCAITMIVLAAFSQLAGEEQPVAQEKPAVAGEQKKFNFWMDVKLTESQKLLEALAKADFDALVKGSQTLETLSAVEGFVRRSTPGYSNQLRAFKSAISDIKAQAEKENLEGVTLGFQQLTLSCVNCHKQIRKPAGEAAGK